ncbi:MAG: hypothetical protein NC548_49415 [Lachnospiraceae bacterium]|nr:hypothetical protein [Lachnospiraceae bacterium]
MLIEVNGSIRRITLDNLMNVINSGDEMLLRQVAWGVPLKQNQSSQAWGVIGTLGMRAEYESKCGRYLVTGKGLAAKLSPTNSAVYADGTTLDETKGNIMFIGPRLYYVVKQDAASGIDYLWLSQLPIGGHYISNCNNDEYICIGAYKSSMSGSTLVSRSGVTPAGSKTIEAFWNAAQVNGKDWGLTNYDHQRYMMMLGLGHYGNPNIQSSLGNGVCGDGGWKDVWGEAAKLLVGATKSLGDALAKIDIAPIVNGSNTTTNSSRVSLFGIEDPYGWQWEMIQGVYCGNSANASQTGQEIFIYEGNRMPTSAELTTNPSGKYRQLARRTVTAKSEGYVKTMILGEYFDIFGTAIGGGATSYWGDYEYINNTGQLVLWGGNANFGSACGLGSAYSRDAFSSSASGCGSRLAYYGALTFMSGKQLIAAA